ncbi:hypothetical protein K474DRAFT_1673662 [Panus rudis PR-1116 ss-1]|nr:hypothetical protein K474DRAFT_1673662 [Panus rudis PR-1116 ss-1]
MSSDSDGNSSSDDDYGRTSHTRRRKRRKTRHDSEPKYTPVRHSSPEPESLFDPLFVALDENYWENDAYFERVLEPLIVDFCQAVLSTQRQYERKSISGTPVVPISRLQASRILDELASHLTHGSSKPSTSLIARKLQTQIPLRAAILHGDCTKSSGPLHVLPKVNTAPPPSEVLDALYNIQTTPYESSFLLRICGFQPPRNSGVIAVDWDTRAPWMNLMSDIREHYVLMHPDREAPLETEAPIEYTTLREDHLRQVHQLLSQVFWDCIDVSDALLYNPEKCTIVATYKKLVVGAAFLSSPQETYITYLAVKPGWDNAQIATKMLYHLIMMHPNKDITLHVSIKNPAMLLYNRFGFKAEEFIVGFYEDYMDTTSRASKNAFRLRLRR